MNSIRRLGTLIGDVIGDFLGSSKPRAPAGSSAENPDLPRHHPIQPPAPSMESEGGEAFGPGRQDAGPGTPLAQGEPDLESGEDRGQEEASSSDDGTVTSRNILKFVCDFVNDVLQIELEGTVTSLNSAAMVNLMVGLALMNTPLTSLFTAGSRYHALYVVLTVLDIAICLCLCLCYKGDNLPARVQKTLLTVSTTALLGALSMLGVGALLLFF